MSTPEQPSEEVKKAGFEKVAQIKIYQLYLIAEVINLASTRGAFRGNELSHVGALFDTLTKGVDQAFKIASEEIEAAKTVEPVTTGLKTVKITDDTDDEIISKV